jgi:hypothetical protein
MISGLTAAGVEVLGRVDLMGGNLPVAALTAEISRWADCGATGLLLDRAPSGPFQLGPVWVAHRQAIRAGLPFVVINPLGRLDPLYRRLGAILCAFSGPWDDYQTWRGVDDEPGDAHLVHSVPATDLRRAEDLMRARGAGLGLITQTVWPPAPRRDAVGAGSGGTSRTTGS